MYKLKQIEVALRLLDQYDVQYVCQNNKKPKLKNIKTEMLFVKF